MLTKLIGYEMKAFGRIILPLYAATLGMSFLIGLGVRFLPEEAYNNFFGATVIMIFSVLIISTMVMTGILCVQRFYQNLLGNEGYLMFSLPVGTHQLILSKILASLIWTFLGSVTALCTGLILAVTVVPYRDLIGAVRILGIKLSELDVQMMVNGMGSLFLWIVVGVLSFTAMLMQIYASLAIGHQWSSHRILGSVLTYFGINTIKGILSGLLVNIGIQTGLPGFIMTQTGQESLVPVQVSAVCMALVLIVVLNKAIWNKPICNQKYFDLYTPMATAVRIMAKTMATMRTASIRRTTKRRIRGFLIRLILSRSQMLR